MLKMFSRSGKNETLQLLCYGKLPLSGEYLKSWAGEGSGKFQGWINALDQNGGPNPRLPRPVRVLMIPDGAEGIVVATVWDSCDNRGRSFPFALYFEAPRQFLKAALSHPVLGSLKLWRFLESEKPTLEASQSSEEFYRELRRPELSVPLTGEMEEAAGFERDLASVSVKALASAVFGGEPFEDWVRLLWRLSKALGPGERAALTARTIALRIPLGKGISAAVQVEAWLKLIRQRAGNSALVPSAILPLEAEDRAGSFDILFRPLRESDVHLLQGGKGTAELLDLVVADKDLDVSGFLEFREMVLDWWERPEAGLKSLLPQGQWALKGHDS